MEAPDKIYIPQRNIEAGTIQELCELIVEGSVEYIRKDALLEWLKERKRLMEEEIGFRLSIDDVIDKLNSL